MCVSERLREVTDGNLCNKLHQRLESLQDLYDVLNLSRVCQHLLQRMLKPEQKGIRKSISGDIINDFFLFPRMKSVSKGRRICDATDVI
jgi:hypothetical protein